MSGGFGAVWWNCLLNLWLVMIKHPVGPHRRILFITAYLAWVERLFNRLGDPLLQNHTLQTTYIRSTPYLVCVFFTVAWESLVTWQNPSTERRHVDARRHLKPPQIVLVADQTPDMNKSAGIANASATRPFTPA
ncbi:hypothetical protein VFPPC_08492 [Pochonia chlamydosporia 170]|uniref:Uncharacterized protein n=1 Tax=Pochonia chlamydosporia 170 TaxID=1380566 RepID=A0A179FN38_METCM|nr:hypothetical protein VFPPC_08492 [Pochonia chlamydosporia 170]OAQ67026.1 hypothetical protein VFPPC_08492 [Pochonia chlamydosporia 170]